MNRVKGAAIGVTLIAAGCAAFACGSADFASGLANAGTDAGGNGGTAASPSDGSAAGSVSADDVLVIHASPDLPAFRLCFDRLPDSVPLPNQKLMPQSNVVGVDVGSAVHIGALDGAHTSGSSDGGAVVDASDATVPDAGPDGVYALSEQVLREQFYPSGDPTGEPSCGVVLKTLTALSLGEGKGFWSLGSLSQNPADSIYGTGVHMLVVAGCLPGSTVTNASQKCQTGNVQYDAVKGNLHAETYQLSAFNKPGFVTQFVQLSPAVDAKERAGSDVEIDFGLLGNPATSLTPVTVSPVYGQLTTAAQLSFDGTDLTNYATYGFVAQIATTSDGESLADIQTQSSPLTVPPDFYALPSNFVVLTIGDPDITAATDPGHALHFLAVPVRDPDTLVDAGADAADGF